MLLDTWGARDVPPQGDDGSRLIRSASAPYHIRILGTFSFIQLSSLTCMYCQGRYIHPVVDSAIPWSACCTYFVHLRSWIACYLKYRSEVCHVAVAPKSRHTVGCYWSATIMGGTGSVRHVDYPGAINVTPHALRSVACPIPSAGLKKANCSLLPRMRWPLLETGACPVVGRC